MKASGAGLRIERPGGVDVPLAVEEVLRAMFPRHARIVVDRELTGGFSGCRVFRVVAHRASSVGHLPAVVKIGPTDVIAQEARAYRAFIRDHLSGIPEIWGDPVHAPDGWSGLRYDLVGGGVFAFESLNRFARTASSEDLWQVIEHRLFVHLSCLWDNAAPGPSRPFGSAFDRVLPVNAVIRVGGIGPTTPRTLIHAATPPDRASLIGDAVRIEGFVVSEVRADAGMVTLDRPVDDSTPSSSYRLRIATDTVGAFDVGQPVPDGLEGTVVGTRATILTRLLRGALGPRVDLAGATVDAGRPDARVLPNPLIVLEALIHGVRPANVGTVHGDLNLENVLVDPEARTVRIVDFAQSRCDDVLHDLLRLETSVVTLLVPDVLAESGCPPEAVCDLLHSVQEASRPGEPAAEGRASDLASAPDPLDRVRLMLLLIRRRAAPLLYRPGDWSEYHAGLVAYLLGASRYRNLDATAQRTAFWAAAMAARHLGQASHSGLDAGRLQAAIERLIGRIETPTCGQVPPWLPLPATAVFGREADVDGIAGALDASACLSIVGAGGVGKTRLALEVARRLTGRFEGRVWYVPLASVSSSAEIDHAIASAVGVAEPAGTTLREAVLRRIEMRTGLVVLDNCEQVLDACRALVDAITRRCRSIRTMMTSREAVRVPGEHVWLLQPLDVPAPDAARDPARLATVPAVQLFVDRVRCVQPEFTLTPAVALAVVRICRDLDGLPLALELAAAQARILPVDQIAGGLAVRLYQLRQDGQISTPHHRTIEAAVGWSFVLLRPDERDLLLRLAVFAGGFTLAAAAAIRIDAGDRANQDDVSGEVDPTGAPHGVDDDSAGSPDMAIDLLDRIASLADKSLVVRPDEQARLPRYRLLGPIRAFALDRLRAADAWDRIAERHAEWYLAWAERFARTQDGMAQAVWLDQVALEHGNLSVALRHWVDRADGPRAAHGPRPQPLLGPRRAFHRRPRLVRGGAGAARWCEARWPRRGGAGQAR